MALSAILALLLFLPSLILAASIGGLSISHPLSQQFPPVARVDQPFQWTFSDDTFSPSSSLTYTAFNLPPWLSFTGSTRTFQGNPTSDDIGNRLVQITATTKDGQSTISDHINLSVSDHSGNLTLGRSIEDQLNSPDSTSITSTYPYGQSSIYYPGVRVPPNWSFSLGFTPSTFLAPTRVYYSASLKDGSPLPTWLIFNNQTVTFDGITVPSADTTREVYEVILSGSDVYGYSDIQQSFTIVISAHEFVALGPMVVNMTTGYANDISLKGLLKSGLSIDGQDEINISDLTSATLDTSSLVWPTYSSGNLSISGNPPSNQQNVELPLNIVDKYGDTLNTTLKMVFYPSLFASDKIQEPQILEIGKSNVVTLAQYLKNSTTSTSNINMTASFDPKEASSWLSLSTDQKTLLANPTEDTDYDSVTVALRAQDLSTNAYSKSILTLSLMSNNSTLTHQHPHTHSHGLAKGTKVAIAIVCSLVGILLLLFVLVQLRRRRTSARTREMGLDRYRSPTIEEEGKWSYEAAETPALEYVEKMGGDPATTQMLVLGRIDGGSSETVVATGGEHGMVPHLRMGSNTSTGSKIKKSFLTNPFFGKSSKSKMIPKISNPIIMPSLSNAAFQAQLAAAVDKAGIVNRDRSSTYSHSASESGGEFTATPSYISGSQIDRSQNSSKLSQRSDVSLDRSTVLTQDSDSRFGGHSSGSRTVQSQTQSSRASWESEPPFVWTTGDTPGPDGDGSIRSSSNRSSSGTHHSTMTTMTIDPNAPTQRADFKVNKTNIPISSSSKSTSTSSGVSSMSKKILKREMMERDRARAGSPIGSINSENEGISIDNIHFPTDSDLAHTETSSLSGDYDPNNGVIIQTASRIDARRTLDSPATESLASSRGSGNHTERGVSPVMTTHSRLVSFGKQKKVEVVSEHDNGGNNRHSMSHQAVIEAASTTNSIGLGIGMGIQSQASPIPLPPTKAITVTRTTPTPPSSLPSLPALPTLPSSTSTASKGSQKKAKARPTITASPQRILLGVSEPFHFYPPLSITPSNSNSSNQSSSTTGEGQAEYLAFVEKRLPSLKKGSSIIIKLTELPDWLHFEDGELWGVPRQQDRGEVDVRIVERKGGDDRVVGRFSLEVSR
ncbi:hypothetical protein I204_01090 [Kwoniella mangroviensis CBS 8886]|nr:hypothetical protein I204_01090 [Kwoniella mangroviensis CBS 8886]